MWACTHQLLQDLVVCSFYTQSKYEHCTEKVTKLSDCPPWPIDSRQNVNKSNFTIWASSLSWDSAMPPCHPICSKYLAHIQHHHTFSELAVWLCSRGRRQLEIYAPFERNDDDHITRCNLFTICRDYHRSGHVRQTVVTLTCYVSIRLTANYLGWMLCCGHEHLE